MPKHVSGFNIKVAAGLIMVGVAVFTFIWLSGQIKPALEPTTARPQSTPAFPGQLDELRAPLPEVMIMSKQEPPIDFVAKRQKDPFVPDWSISSKQDKKDVGEPVRSARVDVQTEKEDRGSEKALSQPLTECHELSALLTLSLASEDFGKDMKGPDEKAGTAVSHAVDAEPKERPEDMETSLNEPTGEQTELKDETSIDDLPSDVKTYETEPAVEWQPNGNVVRDDELSKDESKPQVMPPRLFVTGIITAEDTSYAILRTSTSSIIVQPGDEIEGATVKSVDGDAVIVIKQDEEFVLELGGGGKP